jgi:hypothetical protein
VFCDLSFSAPPLHSLRLCGGLGVFRVNSWILSGAHSQNTFHEMTRNTKSTAETQRAQKGAQRRSIRRLKERVSASK